MLQGGSQRGKEAGMTGGGCCRGGVGGGERWGARGEGGSRARPAWLQGRLNKMEPRDTGKSVSLDVYMAPLAVCGEQTVA